MKFELPTFTQAKINSANVRSEKHGPDELVPAVDLAAGTVTIDQRPGLLDDDAETSQDASAALAGSRDDDQATDVTQRASS